MTMTITRPTPYQLADAITEMVMRLTSAERRRATAAEAYIRSDRNASVAELLRWDRACDRRFRAVQRLTEALRQRADA